MAVIHTHKCYACDDPLTCCCADRRQMDRLTGKERRLYCVWCQMVEDVKDALISKGA